MNLQETIRKVLREETKISPYLRRRIDMLDYEVEYRMSEVYRPNDICRFESGEELLNVIVEAAIDSMYWNYLSNVDTNSSEWVNIYNEMVNYLEDKYGKKLLTYYNDNCNSNKMETTESEFTEYSRTLKNARQQGVGLRFPKSAIKSNPARFRPYNR
jgi:hypothetical protein